MVFISVIENMASNFTKHWNNKEIDRLGYYLSNDIVLTSARIGEIYPGQTSLKGKTAVLAFWTEVSKIHFFTFELKSIQRTGKKITCELKIAEDEKRMIITYLLDEYGKAINIDVSS